MLHVESINLNEAPFPHLVQRQLFSPDLYAALKASYPEVSSVQGWSRMSKDLMRGDAGFAEATSSGPWRTFFDYANSFAFLDLMIGLFERSLHSAELMCDPSKLTLIDHVETREWMASGRVRREVADFQGPLEEVFVRMDFGIGEVGYERKLHLDWRHRLCSLLIYFDDPDETQLEGGRLRIHDSSVDGCPVVAEIAPENNMGIFKVDSNQAFHSVSEVTSILGQRKTLYVAISSRGQLWRDG